MNHLEFYITNVCNLTCDHCRSFNNFKFSGIYEYDDQAMSQWAQKIDLDHYSVLGGEPTLHPRLEQWMSGLRKLWPNAAAELVTNGTHLSKVKGLHDVLVKYNYKLQVSVHGRDLRELIAKEMFLAFGALEIEKIESTNIWFRSSKGVLIELQNTEYLQESFIPDENFRLSYNSDPVEAHKNCQKACTLMIDNKIFKCSMVGLLPEFLRQQGRNSEHMLDYEGMTSERATHQNIMQLLEEPIPHCSICPESPKAIRINAVLKKHLKSKKDILH